MLSTEDRKFWDDNGYVIVRNAVPPEHLKAAEQAIWDYLEVQPDDPESWYANPSGKMIVHIYQHQALWNNRQYPRVHQAFAELWGTEKLWVSLDRASVNPPERPGWSPGHRLHWDMALDLPIPLKVQGVLYLTDTSANQGAFTCVPGFHRKIESWLKGLPPGSNPAEQDLFGLGARPIPGAAGDLIIWHSALPHGSSLNTAERPRMVQYISMFPARQDERTLRSRRVEAWQDRLAGLLSSNPDAPPLRQEKEHQKGHTAELSELGRKLLGLDRWEDGNGKGLGER